MRRWSQTLPPTHTHTQIAHPSKSLFTLFVIPYWAISLIVKGFIIWYGTTRQNLLYNTYYIKKCNFYLNIASNWYVLANKNSNRKKHDHIIRWRIYFKNRENMRIPYLHHLYIFNTFHIYIYFISEVGTFLYK